MTSDAMTVAVSVPTGGREFYTPEALADELQISVGSLKTLRSVGGGPPFVKIGRRVAYPVVGVRIWALQRMQTKGAGR